MATKKVIPIIPVKQITSWSFSRYSTYKQCPRKLKLSALDKIQEPGNAAMARGNEIHNHAEDYIKGKVPKLVAELVKFKALFTKLRKMYKAAPDTMVVEDQWAFDGEWGESQWNNWAQCVVRIKLDTAWHHDDTTLIINDWKSGKFKPESNEDYQEQLSLYALAGLLLHPHVEKVWPQLAYTDLGIFYPGDGDVRIEYTRKDIGPLKKLWAKRTKAMMADKSFAPRPNNNCRWCWYGQSSMKKGGPGICEY